MPGQQEASAQVGRHVLIGRQTHPDPESGYLLMLVNSPSR